LPRFVLVPSSRRFVFSLLSLDAEIDADVLFVRCGEICPDNPIDSESFRR
jgi:hypothetical protein